LTVADVDTTQDNRLNLYWLIGDPEKGKWKSAWIVDHRGFTSSSHPLFIASGKSVHLIWTWQDMSKGRPADGSGLFHLEWSPDGFSKKTRIANGAINTYDAAVDQESGGILVAFSTEDSVYLTLRRTNGTWTRPTVFKQDLTQDPRVSVLARKKSCFLVRINTGEIDKEWRIDLKAE
jgi:hypothetical protein